MNIPFDRSCKETAALITTRQDRELPLSDRVALRVHLAICKACPVFERQVRLMSEAMGQWRAYAQREDAPLKDR